MNENRGRDDILKGFWGKLGPKELELIGTENETHFVKGPDGRRLAVQRSGDPNGHNVFLFHGSPGCRIGPIPRSIVLHRAEINLITYDRPGYGFSDPNPGRRPIDTIKDMEAIVGYCKTEGVFGAKNKFSIIGRSGGGPHALACATGLEGLERVAILGSPAPFHLLGEEQLAGLGSANTGYFSQEREEAIATLTARVAKMQEDPAALLKHISPDFTPADNRVVGNVAIKRLLLESYTEAVRFGPEGWLDDSLAVKADWGFDLGDVKVPVFIGHGKRDPFSSQTHSRYLIENINTVPKLELCVERGSHFDTGFELLVRTSRWCDTGEYMPDEGEILREHPPEPRKTDLPIKATPGGAAGPAETTAHWTSRFPKDRSAGNGLPPH